MFVLYPEPGTRALVVAPGARAVSTFGELAGPTPADLPQGDPPYVKAMFIRIASLTGPSKPVFRLVADTGVAVVLTAAAQPAFSRPGQVGLVGNVWLEAEANNVFAVTVALFDDTPHVWKLGIENGDTHSNYEFTWVVADSREESNQRWSQPSFASATAAAVDVENFPESFAGANVCVDPKTHTVYRSVSAKSLTKRTSTGRVAMETPPGVFDIAHDPVRDALYVTQVAGPSLFVLEDDRIVATLNAGTPGGANPQFSRVAVDPVARKAYVTNSAQNVVAIVDADSHTVLSLIPTGREPGNIAVDPSADTAYVTNAKDNTITVIRGGSVEGTLPALPITPDIPNKVVVAPGGGALFVGSGVGPRIATVDIQSGTTTLVPAVKDSLHSDFTSDIAVDADRYLGFVFLGSQAFQNSPLCAFDTRMAAPLKSAGAATQAYANAMVDSDSGMLYAVFGSSQTFSAGMMVMKVTTNPSSGPP